MATHLGSRIGSIGSNQVASGKLQLNFGNPLEDRAAFFGLLGE